MQSKPGSQIRNALFKFKHTRHKHYISYSKLVLIEVLEINKINYLLSTALVCIKISKVIN